MPDDWMRPHVGDEARPRPGFEDELAGQMHREWSGGAGRLRWWLAAAAVAAVVAGGVALLADDDSGNGTIAPPSSDVAVTPDTEAGPVTTVPVPDTAPPETPETLPDPNDDADAGLRAVSDYLDALGAGDYLSAAELLGRGGLEWEARADLRPLYRPEYGLVPGQSTTENLADALRRWCERSTCVRPTTIGEWGELQRMRATFDVGGVERVALFTGYLDEGTPAVSGLPLQQPPGTDWVACPDDEVDRMTAWADLDGDGWIEQLVPQTVAAAGDESGTRTYRVGVCGTGLVVEPFEVTGDGLAIYPLNPSGDGPDTLLVGFLEGYPNGTMYRFDGARIADLPGTRWDMGPPVVGYDQMSVGCADLYGEGTEAIVNYTYVEADGVLRYTAAPAIGNGDPVGGELASDSPEAGDIRIGMCHGLPVRTD